LKQGNVLRMQIAHRKTQTDHKMLSDRTDALAARVDAVQADLRGAMRSDDDVEALRTRVQATEDLLAELQGRLSVAEVALAEAQAEAQAQVAERVAQVAAIETEVSPCTHAPSALCTYSAAQSDAAAPAPASTTIVPLTPTRKRKRSEDDLDEIDVCDDVRGSEEDEGEDRSGQEGNPVRARCTMGQQQARKRPRRYARAAMQVTTAAVIGAVAAWSALAFV
jgi:DNA-binding protein H-NS